MNRLDNMTVFRRGLSHRERIEKGNRLIDLIATKFQLKGYFVLPSFGKSKGVDVLVIYKKTGKVYAVAECKNLARTNRYGRPQYILPKDFKRDLDHLNLFDILPDIKKFYYISYEDVLSFEQKEVLKANRIKLEEIGYEA